MTAAMMMSNIGSRKPRPSALSRSKPFANNITDMIPIPPDFKDFLRLLNKHKVEYLLIGGYAVAFYGYVRFTGDMDIFVNLTKKNLSRLRRALDDFGFNKTSMPSEVFSKKGNVVRMGVPPLRLEILNQISGVEFAKCYENRRMELVQDISIPFIDLQDLKKNKAASGRPKDLGDLEYLP